MEIDKELIAKNCKESVDVHFLNKNDKNYVITQTNKNIYMHSNAQNYEPYKISSDNICGIAHKLVRKNTDSLYWIEFQKQNFYLCAMLNATNNKKCIKIDRIILDQV